MSDINRLIDAINRARENSNESVLATVVKVEGSAYRRPGARMLISQYNGTQGTISGGCLESHVAKKAWWHTQSAPTVLCYNTALDDDQNEFFEPTNNNSSAMYPKQNETSLEFGLGCNGKVYILLERLAHHYDNPLMTLFDTVNQTGQGGVSATIIAHNTDPAKAHIQIGDRATLSPSGAIDNGIANPQFAHYVSQQLQSSLDAQRSTHYTFEIDLENDRTAIVDVFFDYIAPQQRLVIFGAGDDALPLANMAALMNMHVTVIDSRPQFATKQRFNKADEVLNIALDAPFDSAKLLDNAHIVVMTHSITQDKYWLSLALSSSPTYIGQLGPRYRTEKLLAEIKEGMADVHQIENNRDKLHYPVGLNIGANTPESIAVSICAQLVECMARTGVRDPKATYVTGVHNTNSQLTPDNPEDDVTIYIED